MDTETGDVTIIGSVHISPTYFDHIQTEIRDHEPDRVAVELDSERVQRLFADDAGEFSVLDILRSDYSLTASVLYAGLAITQRKLAKQLGVDPEMNDMRVAVEEAARQGCSVALIDRPISQTLERVANNVSPITLLRVWRRSNNLTEEDLAMVDELEADLLGDGLVDQQTLQDHRELLERVIPEFTDAFLYERDKLMAQRLYALEQQGVDVVAVIGGAHEPGVRAELQRLRENDVPAEDMPFVPECTPTLTQS